MARTAFRFYAITPANHSSRKHYISFNFTIFLILLGDYYD